MDKKKEQEPVALTAAELELREHPVKIVRAKGMMIEVPHVRLTQVVPEAERCTYTWSGDDEHRECGNRKTESGEMCAVHEMWWKSMPGVLGFPCPVDDRSMHLFLFKLTDHMLSGRIRPKEKGHYIQLAQMMMKTVREFER